MAGKNHRPKLQSSPNQIRTERRLTVSSTLAEWRNKHVEADRQGMATKVPWIRLQGKWLAQAGFGIHAPVRVRVMPGCLVLTID